MIYNIDENRFRKTAARRPILTRSADGSLRPASGDQEIGDIWSHQRRLGLAESLAEDRRRAARERLKREHGLVGLAIFELRIAIRRINVVLFGIQSNSPKPKPVAPAGKTTRPAASQPKPLNNHGSKVMEITIALPSLPKQTLAQVGSRLQTLILTRPLRAVSRLPRIVRVGVVVVALAGTVLTVFVTRNSQAPTAGTDTKATVATSKPAALEHGGTPSYSTLLPRGKSIGELGGWTKVSPPGRDPVYAYADTIGRVTLAVSQQPLPPNFKKDTETKLGELAQSYNATEKVSAGGTTIHIGTSAKGPQSAIFSKDDLLILIKSSAPLTNDQWIAYAASLK